MLGCPAKAMHRPDPRRLIGAAAVIFSACGRDEPLSIEIVTPESADLDPTLDDRLAAVTLLDEEQEVVLAEQPFRAAQTEVVFPRLPIDFKGDLRMELLDSGKRILGVGRVLDARLGPGGGSVVGGHKLRFFVRKPLAYVGASRGTSFFDTSRTPRPDEATASMPLPPARVTALAALTSGRIVLVGTESPPELHAIDTRDHKVSRLLELTSPVRHLYVDPTDRMAMLIQDAGMTPFPLPANHIRLSTDILPLKNPAATTATYAPGGGVLLLVTDTLAGECGMGARSKLQRRSPSGEELGPAVDLPVAVSDIAVGPTGNPIVASPCTGEVIEIDVATGARKSVVLDQLPSVSEISVVRNTVVGVGSNTGGKGLLQLHARLSRGGTTEEVRTPWPRARLELRQFTKDMTKVYVEIDPWKVEIRDSAVTPGLDRVVLALRMEYAATKEVGCDGIKITSWGYQSTSLLPNSPGTTYVETKSDVQVGGSCTGSGGPIGYEPTSVAVLFGGE